MKGSKRTDFLRLPFILIMKYEEHSDHKESYYVSNYIVWLECRFDLQMSGLKLPVSSSLHPVFFSNLTLPFSLLNESRKEES